MMLARCTLSLLALVVVVVSPLQADRRDAGPTRTKGRRDAGPTKATQAKDRRDAGPTTAASKPKLPAKMPMTKLAPSKLIPDLCLVRYRISTTSPECQAYFDQALGYFYSYVWMEAARSFETALQYDAECPLAWWGLSRALERWGKKNHTEALLKASQLKDRASHREQQLILARMLEKGQAPGAGDGETRKRKAIATLDDLIALYDDDEEAWYYRASWLAGEQLHGGKASSVPFYKALVRINPLHPGANHELLHYYENSRRPALGWIHAENYIKSSPGLPHAFHMQAHLAMRIGKWAHTTDRSAHAVELERAYHKEMKVKPNDDSQYCASSGDAAALAHSRWPLRRGPRHRGGGTRLRLQTLAAVVPDASRRARLDGDGQNHRRDTQGPQKRQDDAGLLFGSPLSPKRRAGAGAAGDRGAATRAA